MGKEQDEETRDATCYTIFRTGNSKLRHYQINKEIMGVDVDKYWVQLKGSKECWCDCPGFKRQKFPKMEHKHVKIAMDFSLRGEPTGAHYTITGTGAKTTVEYLGTRT